MNTLLFFGVILSVAYASIINAPRKPKRPDLPYGFNDRLGNLRNERVKDNELIIKDADETERKDECVEKSCIQLEEDCTHDKEGCCQRLNPVYCWCYPIIRLRNGSMAEQCFCEDSGDY